MTDPPRYPDTTDETSAGRGSDARISVRSKVAVIVLVVVLLLFVGLHLAGIRPGH